MDKRIEDQSSATVQVDSTLCSRYRCTKSQCAACAVVCPVSGAIRLSSEGAEINAQCVGCGACVSACPNGAISLQEDDGHLFERIRERVQAGMVFRIGCTKSGGRMNLMLPCMSRLTEALMLEPIKAGALRVELLDPDCSTCGLQKASLQWERVMNFSQAVCETAGLGPDRVMRLKVPTGKAEELRPLEQTISSRRSFLRSFTERWKVSGDSIVVEDANAQPEQAETFREIVQRHGENTKRTDLLKVLAGFDNTKVSASVLPSASMPVAHLEVDPRCVGCNVCETLCPVGALSHREEGGVYELKLDAAKCTGCHVCEVACYHQAIHVCEFVDLSVLFKRPRVTLVSAARHICASCRESFLGDSSDLCPACRVSGDRRDVVARRFFLGGNQSDQF